MSNAIQLTNLSKTFIFSGKKGLRGLLRPQKKQVVAVKDITISVERGESVAFIGPNGAGKSTTIKMLTGILSPTGGQAQVLGFDPLRQRRDLALRIGTVFGQRSQLVFNLPLTESFNLSAHMYGVPQAEAAKRTAELIKLFNLADFADQPVRKLSLGQRMRAEVANALLHNPDIIFLDEPTIGLDVVAKRALREVLKTVNRLGTTIFLTSHDVGDIEEVCERTVIINHGQVMLDAPTADLRRDYLQIKTITIIPAVMADKSGVSGKVARVTVDGVAAQILPDGRLQFSLDTRKNPLKAFLKNLLDAIDIEDLTIENTPLEDIIHEIYTAQTAH